MFYIPKSCMNMNFESSSHQDSTFAVFEKKKKKVKPQNISIYDIASDKSYKHGCQI